MAIRAVLFDLDDTLFDHAGCAREALAAVRAAHTCFSVVDAGELERRHAAVLEALHGEVAVGRMPLEAARIERFRRLFAAVGVEADAARAAAAAAAYRDAYLRSHRPVSGAAALLEAVRARASVGVVSNNLLKEQQEKLRCCGLDRFVDCLVVSEEVGVAKPDPRIFEVALERLRCSPDEAVMVGDAWGTDIVGARAAGIRAVLYAPGGTRAGDVPVLEALEPVSRALRVIFGEDARAAVR